MRLKLEDKLLRVLKPGDYHDTLVPRLTLRVRDKARRWVIRYRLPNEAPQRLSLGDLNVLSLAEAREVARRELALVDRGEDPRKARREIREAERRRRAGASLKKAAAAWLRDTKHGPTTRWKGGAEGGSARSFLPHVRRLICVHGETRLSDLTPLDIERFVSGPKAANTRNHALTVVRSFLTWARRRRIIERNTLESLTEDLSPERGEVRSRVLSDDELRALIRGFAPTRYGRAVRLLTLTGLRRDEVLGARWSWLDTGAGLLTIPPEAEKMGRARGEARRVALSQAALALLAEQRAAQFAEGVSSEFIFATSTGGRPHRDALKPILYSLKGRRPNGKPASTDKRAKLRPALLPPDATIHDVRRTVADGLLNRIGAAPWIVDHVILGHVRPKLLRTYMPTLPLDEARQALTRWSEILDGVVAGGSQPLGLEGRE